MDRPEIYTNDGQQRLMRLVMLLAGNEVTGMAPKQIAELQECSPAVVTRDLANLLQAGWAEQIPDTNHWRLAPQVVQISLRHAAALARAEDRLAEIKNRFSRS